MKLSIQKLIAAFLSCILSVSTPVQADSIQNWYMKRQKDHRRPEIESEMTYIEDCNAVCLGKDEKVIYLTFDAGYENGNISRILDTLQKHEVQGAFFILENLIKRNPELVKRMKEEGHLVCNHTAKHGNIAEMTEAEIKKEIETLECLYRETIGGEMAPFFRPPEGKFNENSLKIIQNMGYSTVFWSLAYADWDNNKQPSKDSAMKILCDNIHNGAIILLHPTSKTNADILDELITKWKAEGYRFGSLEECRENR